MRRGLGRALVSACLCTCALSGCTHAAANAVLSPALEMPPPPARDIEPAALPAVVEAPTQVAAPAPTPPPEPRRGAAPRPAPPREPPRADPPKPQAPTRPPANLQTTPATEDEELERGIRATLARASADLDRSDYRRLGADARTQYDTARRFILQADEAVRTRNLVFARNLADKALALATQLVGK